MKLVTVLFLLFFLGVLGMSLFHHSGVGVMSDISSGQNCPFMTENVTLCPMDSFAHLAYWKATFLSLTPTFLILSLLLGAVTLVIPTFPNTLLKPAYTTIMPFLPDENQRYAFSRRLLQELFSNGILHPKLFTIVVLRFTN